MDTMEDEGFLPDGLSPTIAEHAAQCHALLHKYVAIPGIVPDPTVVDDQLARFSLWSSNMEVYGPLNVSLDYRLRFSPTAAEIIHQLLDIIRDTLLSLEPIDDRPPHISSRKRPRVSVPGAAGATRRCHNDDDDDDDDDASSSDSQFDAAEENILKMTATIGGTLTRLFRLSNAVRKSAKANRARKIERYTDDPEANQAIQELRLYTTRYMEFRFPAAPEALRSALVEANALRLRRLYYQRSHQRRIAQRVLGPPTIPALVQLPGPTASALAGRSAAPSALPTPATANRMPTPVPVPVPVPATNATTARQTAVAALYADRTTEVPRARSALVNNKLSFPPRPPTQQCPYCGVIVEFKHAASALLLWQNHVLADLEPFVCVSPHCLQGGRHGHGSGPLTFETSKAWSSHMQTARGHTWECRAPSHSPMVFDREMQYQEHSIAEHGVPEAHAGTLSNAARRPLLAPVLECPFGDDFQAPAKGESSAVFSSDALQVHVAGHMKEIALLALQKLPSDDDEHAGNVGSDQPSEGDGQAGAFGVTRASMYSVLDNEELDFSDNGVEAADGTVGHGKADMSPGVTILGPEDRDDLGMTKLHQAVQGGDLGWVTSTIQDGPSVNCRDNNGQTALHYAAERGFVACIEVLVQHGADWDLTDNSGFSPCLWAVVSGQESATALLLSMGAGIHVSSAQGKSALAWAASLGWSPIVRMLLEHHASTLHPGDAHQTLPLQEAAVSGHLPLVRWLLLDCGADPNHRDRDGWSAIHWAAEEGHLDVVRTLLDLGANPNAVSSYGTSPLHCAANGGHASIVSLLLLQGADPARSTCHGWTALHRAAFMGHSHVVQSLLEDERVRSNAAHQDNHGWSVLHLAVHSRDLATIRILLDKSVIAEPQALCDEGGLAAEEWLDRKPTSYSHKATANLAFSKSRCCRAVTRLRQAVATGNIPMIKLLCRLGDDINGMNSGKRTSLYYAAKNHMLSVMDLLLDLGADPNVVPAGRKNWEECIASGPILQRLEQAGYRKRETDAEVERQIRAALGVVSSQPSAPEQWHPAWLRFNIDLTTQSPDPSVANGSQRPSPPSSAPASSTPPPPGHASSSSPTRSPAPRQQTNVKKRKAGSGRTEWWKRLIGRR